MPIWTPRGEILAKGDTMMQVKLKTGIAIEGVHHDAGSVVSVVDELGYDLIGSGRGVEAEAAPAKKEKEKEKAEK